MSFERVGNTALWNNTLGVKSGQFNEKREELRASYMNFREKTAHLVSKISGTLPGLTQHDVSHLDALWEVADLICGDSYPFNPIEAYVFGGAILLHDSALCFEAYDGGVEEVRSTAIWKDTLASVLDSVAYDEAVQISDFAALRYLHAHQAESLTEKSWLDPESKSPLFLIENSFFRKHLGRLIGQIAASHHWSIEEVSNKLPLQVNALPGFPRDWRIDPIKIACMLRCADAAHIDNERAPDFLHALIKRRGVSFTHWKAQNKLASVDVDQSDSTGSTLIFTSTHRFLENESEAWWVAYDAVCMVEKEIRASNALLETRSQQALFQVKRVKGVESPELMSKYIQTEGWSPCMAEVYVGNIENLVRTLGGEKLYGESCDKFEVMVRELIQNARDSIQARKELEKDFKGKILISLEKSSTGYCLCIEDDGVGMSKRVLIGPLLDFGTSFWTSTLVHSEFPGLRSSKFKAVGQFGIGFYSVFMGAEKVVVASRPWNGGSSDVWQLNFNRGLSLRPLLKNTKPDDFKTDISTQVKLDLKPEILVNHEEVEVKRNVAGAENLKINAADFISSLCAALDVSVFFKVGNCDYTEIHRNILLQDDYQCWLDRISYAKYQSTYVSNYISNNVERLRPIVEDGLWHGLAAISTSSHVEQSFLNVRTVGNLCSSVHGRSGEDFIGYVNYLPKSARREGLKFSASPQAIESWAKEQIEILHEKGITPLEKCQLAYSLCYFDIDPIDVANVVVCRNNDFEILSFEELALLSVEEGVAFVKASYMDHVDAYSSIKSMEGKALFRPIRNSNFLSLKMLDGKPENDRSVLGCLFRKIIQLGYKPEVRIESEIGKSMFGMNDALIVTSKTN
ncbi:HD domain-containing protein [Billgrantia pellis]|uniref:HD domain-containing protein n=1 Tax=Billgrantia pellis TaxID=2606936 RepID=UPI001E580918|nr:ATP-binding protein [Halomonas pellis]